MVTWLVHPVGEADLGLDSRPDARAARGDRDGESVASRVARLHQVIAGGAPAEVTRLLVEGAWHDESGDAGRRPPLAAALDALGSAGGGPVTLVLLGTQQSPPHPRDTHAVAQVLAEAVRACTPMLPVDVGQVRVAVASGQTESAVIEALHTAMAHDPQPGDVGAVTWASGPSALALAAVTAVVQAGLRWSLVELPAGRPARLVDPLDQLGVDPVVALLVRWRMFPALAALTSSEPPLVRLDAVQRQVVDGMAQRWHDGYQALSASALRGLVLDALVRRDGTAGVAARRYVEARYAQMHAAERAADGAARDLLAWAENAGGEKPRRTLGHRVEYLRSRAAADALGPEAQRPSALWLLDKPVQELIEIGKASHSLSPPRPNQLQHAYRALAGDDEDTTALHRVGLPSVPVGSPLSVFAVWIAGLSGAANRPSVGQQLLADGLGGLVRDHLDVDGHERAVDLHALVLGIGDSVGEAEKQRQELFAVPKPSVLAHLRADHAALPDLSLPGANDAAAHIVASHVPPGADALVLVPTGRKDAVLPLVRALRRIGAERGIPLFLREMSTTPGRPAGVHLWPALVGGDLPLLVAARESVHALELDAAWRLLAATSVASTLGARCHRLATAFACRAPDSAQGWPAELPAPSPDRRDRTVGMMADRLRLVRHAHQAVVAHGAAAGDDVRLLVLGACAVEVSVGQVDNDVPGRRAQPNFRDGLERIAAGAPRNRATQAARVLLVLNEARDRAPVTHGQHPDPNAAVQRATADLAAKWGESARALRARLVDVATLLDAAVDAAEHLHPTRHDILAAGLIYQHELVATNLAAEIFRRQR
ncbi:MAG: hypothetical protein HYR62_03225 [Actinobacteria bacterium]|nr:hypothetical protein [Actinomycetota bacterium]MBI3689019.1 hypothetical protein [Actinomycetota bacterium]